jgi:hypothetical protein
MRSSIELTHQESKQRFHFFVGNPEELTQKETNNICKTMDVKTILVNKKIYKIKPYGNN